MIICGIDYSVEGPALCIFNLDKHGKDGFCFDNCVFYYMTQSKKKEIATKNIFGLHVPRKEYKDKPSILWYKRIADWVTNIMEEEGVNQSFIEDYAFSRNSRSTTILAENGAILKLGLTIWDIPYQTVPSTAWKKHCIDRGNANKQFIFETMDNGPELLKLFDMTDGSKGPISDIIDSYYICKFGVDKVVEKSYN